MTQIDDLSRSVDAFDQDASLTVVVEMSEASWLVTGMVPGVDRRPLKKLEPDPDALLRLVERWRSEAEKTGRTIERVALAYEAGRDGFWLARWLRVRGIEVHVIHSTSVAVSREHRRAKTDRLDTAMLMRVFLGWLRGERGHCGMVAIPTLEEEDAKQPTRSSNPPSPSLSPPRPHCDGHHAARIIRTVRPRNALQMAQDVTEPFGSTHRRGPQCGNVSPRGEIELTAVSSSPPAGACR
jgi:hypothetical protein